MACPVTKQCSLLRFGCRYHPIMTRKRFAPVVAATAISISISCTGYIGGGGTDPGTISRPLSDLPCEVETLMVTNCWGCHGDRPAEVDLPSLTTVASLSAPSGSDPTKTYAESALALMQSNATPMPPLPAARVTAAEVTVLADWVAAGYPAGTGCAPVCTSNMTWTRGNHESPEMNPGKACIACHASDEGPRFTIAGTLYPTAHEPDLCDGADGANGAQILITGADGQTLTLSPNAAGNFYSNRAVALPYQAKVVFMGREQVMADQQTSGDCNGCHTQAGANEAPGASFCHSSPRARVALTKRGSSSPWRRDARPGPRRWRRGRRGTGSTSGRSDGTPCGGWGGKPSIVT